MSKPKVTYTVSLVSLSGILGYKNRIVPLNSMVHLYDHELDINDFVHVSSVTKYLDSPEKDTVELSNEPLSLTSITVDSILSRMVQLSDLIDQKNSLYSRSEIISSEGSIQMNRLEGTINVLKNRLSSANSGWYTDDNGNMVFESVNGMSAMMLTGEGFMIASGKDENGNWDWRTFGSGEGFTADAIVTGYLSADRIEAGTISAEKLTGDVGTEIDLSNNGTIRTITTSTNQMSKDIESINRDMENKVDYDQMASHVSTVVEQTTNSWGVAIDNVNESIKNVGDQIQNVDNSIKTWMRFSEDG